MTSEQEKRQHRGQKLVTLYLQNLESGIDDRVMDLMCGGDSKVQK